MSTTNDETARPDPGSLDQVTSSGRPVNRYAVFGIVVSAVIMSGIDASIVATALPTLRTSLHARLSWSGWTITAYQFGLVMTLPVAGRISDQFGRRRILLCCLVVFTASSLVCASATSIYELVAFRAIQAIGGGAFFPSAVGIVTDHFGKDRDRAVGMISSVGPLGTLTGPVLGGVIVGYWSWRGVFLINVPIGFVIFFLTLRYIPPSRRIDALPADYRGVALLGGMLLPLMYGITSLGDGGATFVSPPFLVSECFAVLCGFLFIHHAKVTEAPVIPLRLLYKGGYGKLNAISFLNGGCTIGCGLLLPLYAEQRYHFKSLEAGTVLSARAAGALTVAALTAFLIRRVGYRRPLIVGTIITAVAIIMLSFRPDGLGDFAWIALFSALFGIGLGISVPSTNNAMLHKTITEAGSISGLRQMFLQIGAIAAISISTTIVSRSHNEGLAIGHAFLVFGLIIAIIILPLVCTIDDHRGRW